MRIFNADGSEAQMQMMPSAPTEKCRAESFRASGTMFSGTPEARQSR